MFEPMTTESPGPDVDDPLVAALDAATDAVRVCGSRVSWRTRERVLLDAVRRVSELRSMVESLHLDLVRQVDDRGVATTSPVATSVEGFLRSATSVGAGQARRDVAAARATSPGAPLERFGTALAAGRTSRAHVDVAVRCLERVPAHLAALPAAQQQIVDLLEVAAAEAGPPDMDRTARRLVFLLAPDEADRFDPAAHQRRFLDLHTDATGMVVGRFQLDAVTGAHVTRALDHCSAPRAGADDEPDRRDARQRRADALGTLAETALGVSQPRRGERPRVVLHITPEQLFDLTAGRGDGVRSHDPIGGAGRSATDGARFVAGLGYVEGSGPLGISASRRLACDAVLQRVITTASLGPLDVGREHRIATLAQRRALAFRDGGCIIPGCGARPDWCDAHHIVHWVDGGQTDLANLVLLCPGHHTAVHAGSWHVRVDDGQIVVVPPRWVDPARRPRTVRHHRVADTLARLHRPHDCSPEDSPRTHREAHDGRSGAPDPVAVRARDPVPA